MPAKIWEDDEFRPIGVSVEGQMLEVVSIDDRVEEESEWWETEPVYKMHYRVTLADGRELGIFRNYKTGSWYHPDEH
jgi:hypothetical protein